MNSRLEYLQINLVLAGGYYLADGWENHTKTRAPRQPGGGDEPVA